MRSGTADGLFWEVHDAPTGAPSVVLSAGLGGSAAFWSPQMQALTERFRVILYDHRGTSRSDRSLKPDHTVAAMAEDIVTVLDATDTPRAHLVGHAAGGNAGLQLALDHPERLDRLVVVNGWSRPDPHVARCFAARTHLLEAFGPAAYVEAQALFLYPPDWISQNDAALRISDAHHVENFPHPDVMLARIGTLLAFDIDDRLSEIVHPVLVSASADDMLIPPRLSRRLAEGLPNATLDVVRYGGHAFTATVPDVFNARLIAFLLGDA
ncbi:Putative aminoacrylate hydrolase RutD [Brevundimonas sp. NIBR10]|uniref:pyrimidine utilization protein D n=1 Tax=Brevundimonas sp. NIBR10 TaxID=3015997 RepID=UPI0022F1C69C|nr:pyrimidine utilization protein D [Brevundimonas sp. NIBR10]WGM46695.1 Putative aminoacrylate hydrolase RutD [Brevundimonas sp. NIBR10]